MCVYGEVVLARRLVCSGVSAPVRLPMNNTCSWISETQRRISCNTCSVRMCRSLQSLPEKPLAHTGRCPDLSPSYTHTHKTTHTLCATPYPCLSSPPLEVIQVSVWPLRPGSKRTQGGVALWNLQWSVAERALPVRCHSRHDILQCVRARRCLPALWMRSTPMISIRDKVQTQDIAFFILLSFPNQTLVLLTSVWHEPCWKKNGTEKNDCRIKIFLLRIQQRNAALWF